MNKKTLLIISFALFSTTSYHIYDHGMIDKTTEWFKDQFTFAKIGFNNKNVVGTIFQCSGATGKRVASKIPPYWERNKPINVVEFGPGVGAVTEEAIKLLNFDNGDCLDLIEIEKDYCKRLHEKFGYLEKKYPDNFHIYQQDALQFSPEQKYDIILNTIPFNACPVDFVIKLLKACEKKFINQQSGYGWFSFVEYPRAITQYYKETFAAEEELKNFNAVQETMETLRQTYKSEHEKEWFNMPPGINVYHVNLNEPN